MMTILSLPVQAATDQLRHYEVVLDVYNEFTSLHFSCDHTIAAAPRTCAVTARFVLPDAPKDIPTRFTITRTYSHKGATVDEAALYGYNSTGLHFSFYIGDSQVASGDSEFAKGMSIPEYSLGRNMRLFSRNFLRDLTKSDAVTIEISQDGMIRRYRFPYERKVAPCINTVDRFDDVEYDELAARFSGYAFCRYWEHLGKTEIATIAEYKDLAADEILYLLRSGKLHLGSSPNTTH
jgi:hypothetical protein